MVHRSAWFFISTWFMAFFHVDLHTLKWILILQEPVNHYFWHSLLSHKNYQSMQIEGGLVGLPVKLINWGTYFYKKCVSSFSRGLVGLPVVKLINWGTYVYKKCVSNFNGSNLFYEVSQPLLVTHGVWSQFNMYILIQLLCKWKACSIAKLWLMTALLHLIL